MPEPSSMPQASDPIEASRASAEVGSVEPESPGLALLQGWMQSVVTHCGDAASGVLSPEACAFLDPGRLPHLVKASGALSPLERIEIYQGMYRPRMVDALASVRRTPVAQRPGACRSGPEIALHLPGGPVLPGR